MTIKYISSQRYIDDEIVSAKIEANDFEVLVSPSFEIDGEMVAVILDGHHSYHAAVESGVSPEFVEATAQNHDAVALIESDADTFLEAVHMGDDYYYVDTGITVW